MLGYDLRNESVTDRVWSIISNKEVLRVNRAWFGHPGHQVATGIGGNGAVEVWAKQIAKGEIAVFALNAGTTSANATLSLADVGAPASALARDLWSHQDIGQVHGELAFEHLAAHDSAFYLLSTTADD